MLFKLRSVQHWHADETRWAVFAPVDVVALLSFGASAWTLAGRGNFIGGHPAQRLEHLHRVVSNARFLIQAWIQCKGLASGARQAGCRLSHAASGCFIDASA